MGNRIQLNASLRCGSDGPTVASTWTWISSNSSVVSVDANGLATGVARGTATVTATSVSYAGVNAQATVNARVFSTFLPSITPAALIMSPGTAAEFRASVSEEPNAPIVWSIDNPEIATVDATGLVRAPQCGVLGSAVVTARNAADPTISVSAALTVRHAGTGPIAIQYIRDSIDAQPVDVGHVRGIAAIRIAFDNRIVRCSGLSGVDVVVRSVGRDDIVLVAKLPTYPETSADVYVNTASRLASGEPRTPNGNYSIFARAFDADAKLIEETPHISVTFDNP